MEKVHYEEVAKIEATLVQAEFELKTQLEEHSNTELDEVEIQALEVIKLHRQKVAKMKSTLKQAEIKLRSQLLEYKTSNTKLQKQIDEKEEELSKQKILALEAEKLLRQKVDKIESTLTQGEKELRAELRKQKTSNTKLTNYIDEKEEELSE